MSRLVVLVTGANAGLGLGICQRLILQLADGHSHPFSGDRPADAVPLPCQGLTLIMACRSTARADTARKSLYALLDSHINRVRARPNYDGFPEKFRDNLKIDICTVDLSKISTVFQCAQEISTKYPYITHMVLNAGAASWSHINWLLCAKQFILDPKNWVARPNYNVQHVGETSEDGLGWVWQTNLFGHFVLFRMLQPLLIADAFPFDARVVWLSSLTASRQWFDVTDWQILKNEHSYETVKYEIDLLASYLDSLALSVPDPQKRIRHFVAHPSVCSTDFGTKLSGQFGEFCKLICYYIARYIGSTVHVILPFFAALSVLHVALTPLPDFVGKDPEHPVKYGTRNNRRGHPRVETEELVEYNKEDAKRLLEHCDTLLADLRKA